MKKAFSKKIYGFMLMSSFALIMTSCQKEQNGAFKSSSEVQSKFNTNGNGIPEISTCSPIPDSLQVPEGNKFFLQTFARGVQIYEIQRSASDPNTLVWVNIAPLATLYIKPDFVNPIIDHFAGPSWQFIKGPFKDEKVVAKKVKGSTQDATAIQWLLLKADDALSTPGNPVTFVQRICTEGGLAPATIPVGAQPGQLDSIPYKASYLFYTKN
ncbi:MAG TPA: DUF3455 domain-containing protein [Chitinophagaceae bacterium]|nr:DUF3455 domain-containing protein [Chitinophagaceae bacterium]